MQAVVVLTSCETEAKSGQYGPYTLFKFKDAGGNRYACFKDDVGFTAQRLLNQPVSLTYDEEVVVRNNPQTGQPVQYTNRKITSCEAAAGAPPSLTPQIGYTSPQIGHVAPQTSGGSQDQFRRSKHELRRSETLSLALELHKANLAPVNNFDQLLASADYLAGLLENGWGGNAPGTAPTVPATTAAAPAVPPSAGAQPVAFDPQTGQPIY